MLNFFCLESIGDFGSKVKSNRSHITTHFDAMASSCGWHISDVRLVCTSAKTSGRSYFYDFTRLVLGRLGGTMNWNLKRYFLLLFFSLKRHIRGGQGIKKLKWRKPNYCGAQQVRTASYFKSCGRPRPKPDVKTFHTKDIQVKLNATLTEEVMMFPVLIGHWGCLI